MVRFLNSIAARMVIMAMVITSVTMAIGFAMYRTATYYRLEVVSHRLPPQAKAELDELVRRNLRGSDRYYEVFDRYDGAAFRSTDLAFLAIIAMTSVVIGGCIALLLARRISRPITAVAQAAARISAGDRSTRVRPYARRGEIGDLVASFNRMAIDIETYQRERTVLTAGIAHELRTPLTILKGRLHAIEDGVIDPTTGEAGRLLRHVEQLSRLVDDLRELAHADAGELAIDRTVVDVADTLRAVVMDFTASASERNIRIVEAYTSAMVSADAIRLTQIFANLLTNALKHAPDGSRIDVALFTARRSAVVSVIDEGEGFNPHDERRIFLPFWRAPTNRIANRAGSGMGLALAAKMAEAHGGRIVAKNRIDRSGAIFCVWIPLTK